LLAIPLTLLTKAVLIDVDPSTRWLDLLIGAEGPRAARAPAVALSAVASSAAPEVDVAPAVDSASAV
jgi:AI-2 transport protein TqsA